MFVVFTVTGDGPMEWLENVATMEEFKVRNDAGVYTELAVPPSFVFALPCAAFVDVADGRPAEYAITP